MKKLLIIFVIIISFSKTCLSQEYDVNFLENILEKISDETGSSPELDAIEQLIENPIYLKDSGMEEFLRIPGFTTSEAKTILNISKIDTINNFIQLFSIISLSDEQKYLLRLCSTFDKPWKFDEQYNFYIRTRAKLYLNEVRGFKQNIFKGDESDVYNRLTFYSDNFSFGLLTDKDAGELYLADHYSGYFSGNFQNIKFTVGDYYIESGMGTLLWKSTPVGKSAEVIYPVLQKGSGIRDYRSSIDYRLFRGAAFEKKFDINGSNLNLLFWFSNTDRAGTLDTSNNTITAVYKTGYYRTSSEISKKTTFNEKLIGGNMELKNEFLSIGFTAFHLLYDKGILSESKYAFYGKEGTMLSLYSYFDLKNISIGAELSSDANGNAGFKAGSQIEFGNYEIALNMRSFTPNFRSQYGHSFGESSAPNNEYGFYTGFRYNGIKNLRLSAYADFYGSYEKTYYVPEPTKGNDFFLQTDWKIDKAKTALLRISVENKTDAKNITGNSKEVFQKEIYRIRGEYEEQLMKSLSYRIRLEANYIGFKNIIPDENGTAGFFEFEWFPYEFIQFGCRFSVFSTKSFESVVYQYEMAMPGYMTSVPLYYDGFRSFIFIKVTPIQNLDFWMRYSITQKNNVSSLGSGYLEIQGNIDQRLMLQLDCSF